MINLLMACDDPLEKSPAPVACSVIESTIQADPRNHAGKYPKERLPLLVVGCGKNPYGWQKEAQRTEGPQRMNFWSAEMERGDHTHPGAKTMDSAHEVCPDLLHDITRPIDPSFPYVFGTIYLEKLPRSVVLNPMTWRNVNFMLRPGGKVCFDPNFSLLHRPIPHDVYMDFKAKGELSCLDKGDPSIIVVILDELEHRTIKTPAGKAKAFLAASTIAFENRTQLCEDFKRRIFPLLLGEGLVLETVDHPAINPFNQRKTDVCLAQAVKWDRKVIMPPVSEEPTIEGVD